MVIIFSPVGLDEDAVDVFELRDAGLVAHRFDELVTTAPRNGTTNPDGDLRTAPFV